MRQIEGDCDRRGACRRKPFVTQVTVGTQSNTTGGKVFAELANARFEFRALYPKTQIADAHGEQFIILKPDPRRAAGTTVGSATAGVSAASSILYPNVGAGGQRERVIRFKHTVNGFAHAAAKMGSLRALVMRFDIETQPVTSPFAGHGIDARIECLEDAAAAQFGQV
jgi:hypothetical protein